MEAIRRAMQQASTVIRREPTTAICSLNDVFMMVPNSLWLNASVSASVSGTGEIRTIYTEYNECGQWLIPVAAGGDLALAISRR
jgi:hypothetical protein